MSASKFAAFLNTGKGRLTVLTAAAILAGGAWIFADRLSAPGFEGPVAYADGSVEYALIDRLVYKRGAPDGYYEKWVLRFPGLVECKSASGNGRCSYYEPRRILPEAPDEKNRELRLRLYLPSLDFVDPNEKVERRNVVDLRIDNSSKKFKEDVAPGHLESSFRGSFRRSYEIKCVKNLEIVPGLFELREPTPEERSRKPGDYKKVSGQKCNPGSAFPVTYYSLYSDDGEPRGGGKCVKGDDLNCAFTIWLPQGRTAGLSFSDKHLRDIPEIYKKIAEKLIQATDKKLSKNLSWGS